MKARYQFSCPKCSVNLYFAGSLLGTLTEVPLRSTSLVQLMNTKPFPPPHTKKHSLEPRLPSERRGRNSETPHLHKAEVRLRVLHSSPNSCL